MFFLKKANILKRVFRFARFLAIATTSLFFFAACGADETEQAEEENVPGTEISFSRQQVQVAGIETGEIQNKNLSAKIDCKGKIEALPQNRAKISVPKAGYVKQIFVNNGQNVRKGKALLSLQHPAYIDVQKNYLQAKSRLAYIEKEYERQKVLAQNNAGTGKVLEKTKAEYEEMRTELMALKLQLQLLNIEAEKLNVENIRSTITIFAPISGNINEILITTGQYVEPQEMLFEIINNSESNIDLQVFERDIHKIAVGQKVTYECNIPESKDSVHWAEIVDIGNQVDEITKTFRVHAKPKACHTGMRHGIYVNAQILLSGREVPVVPEEALVQEGDEYFLFVAKNDTLFEKHDVETGLREGGFVEIKNRDLAGKKIVIQGANYIIAEMGKE